MRISDWSSYVCSSDLACRGGRHCTRFARVHRLVACVVFLACGMLYIRRQRCRAMPVQQVQHAFGKLDLEELALPPSHRGGKGVVGQDQCAARLGRLAGLDMGKGGGGAGRSEEHTSELQSLMRNSYAVFCLKKKTTT